MLLGGRIPGDVRAPACWLASPHQSLPRASFLHSKSKNCPCCADKNGVIAAVVHFAKPPGRAFPAPSARWATMVTLTTVILPVATPTTAGLPRVGSGSVVVGEGKTRLQSRLELG